MAEPPEVHYAQSGDVHVAYQTWGDGPNVVIVPPFAQNIEEVWSDPTGLAARFLERFGGFATVTHFDKRGTGLSDRVPGFGVEERMEDLHSVMDAAGIEQAFIGGISEGGPMAMLFAATYPERTQGLVLLGSTARFIAAPDYPHGVTPEFFETTAGLLVGAWGTPESLFGRMWLPSLVDNEPFQEWLVRYQRASASPGAIREMMRFVSQIDVRSVLPAIQCRTLVIHRRDDLVIPLGAGRYLAEQIPGAEFVELDGNDHIPWAGDQDSVLAELEEFVTGERRTAPREATRVLATVLFTDICDSTARASELGDDAWRQLLDRHDALVRAELSREEGREVKTTGDGFLATFDSPSRAVRAADAIRAAARDLGVELRAGLHTGEVELRGDDVAGLGVHVGARIAALAGPSEVLVSGTVRDLVLGGPFRFEDRGRHALKGVDGEWAVLALA